jgi:cold shock protein
MPQGTVKFFNDSKGYGFIKDDATGTEFFVHITNILDGAQLKQDDAVEFESRIGKKGQEAFDVKLAD